MQTSSTCLNCGAAREAGPTTVCPCCRNALGEPSSRREPAPMKNAFTATAPLGVLVRAHSGSVEEASLNLVGLAASTHIVQLSPERLAAAVVLSLVVGVALLLGVLLTLAGAQKNEPRESIAMSARALEPAPAVLMESPAPSSAAAAIVPPEIPTPPALAHLRRKAKAGPVFAVPLFEAFSFAREKKEVTKLRPLVVKRIRARNDEELRRELALAPELALEAVPEATLKALKTARRLDDEHLAPVQFQKRPDLRGLPLRLGDECRLGKEPAEALHSLSRKLRACLAEAAGLSRGRTATADVRPDPEMLRHLLLNGSERHLWLVSDAVPTLQQLLMAENRAIRVLLVQVLAQIKDKSATVALAQRAVFDLHPEVRTAALEALTQRPTEDFEDVLIAALRYPWRAANEHAAEALVALEMTASVPRILQAIERGDPGAPIAKETDDGPVTLVREVVRVNHLSNCVLCHARSAQSNDLVRGLVPDLQKPPPPAFSPQYYGDREIAGNFVRADVTYLKQDFSLFQPVPKHGAWPENQRFDYMVRVRKATQDDLFAVRDPDAYRAAPLFALRHLK
jgi:hypothetical protein